MNPTLRNNKSVYRYYLDRSSKKFICPNCGRRTFVRYKDVYTNSYLDNPNVGKCDRSAKCGYHFPPRMAGYGSFDSTIARSQMLSKQTSPEPTDYTLEIDTTLFYNHRKESGLYRYLERICPDKKRLEEVAMAYNLGTNRTGGIIFWQQDLEGRIRTGKIMHHDPQNGKRIHSQPPQWVHCKLPRPTSWQLLQCPFGLHLLRRDTSTPIGLVESEKTAIILSLFCPQRLWLATGGKSNLSDRILRQIPRSEIALYPDKDAFSDWQSLAEKLQLSTNKRLSLIPWHLPYPTLPHTADPSDLFPAQHLHSQCSACTPILAYAVWSTA